jgi:hypothetical protein
VSVELKVHQVAENRHNRQMELFAKLTQSPGSTMAAEHAMKASLHNETVAMKLQQQAEQEIKRVEVAKASIGEKIEATLQLARKFVSDRAGKASQHNEEVASRAKNQADGWQQRKAQLESKLAQKNAICATDYRTKRASEHNQAVALTVQAHAEETRNKNNLLRAKWAKQLETRASHCAKKARRHNDTVVTKVMQTNMRKKCLEADLRAGLAKKFSNGTLSDHRLGKARLHNQNVATAVHKHQHDTQIRLDILKAKVARKASAQPRRARMLTSPMPASTVSCVSATKQQRGLLGQLARFVQWCHPRK